MRVIRRCLSLSHQKIEVIIKGKTGSPILIVSGMASSFDEWYELTEALSKSNRVIMFHRPGLGKSELCGTKRNTQKVVNEMVEIIHKLHITEPVTLVGHSYGGLCVQHFMKQYPEKVLGVVLVDSTSVDFGVLDELDLPVMNEDSTDDAWLQKCLSYSTMKTDEIKSLIEPIILTQKELSFPPEIQKRLLEFPLNPTLYKAMYLEISNWKHDAQVIKNMEVCPDLPLIVIGRDKEHCVSIGIREGLPETEITLLEDKWEQLIKEQIYLTKKSNLIFAKGSNHSVHLDRPDIIINSVKKIEAEIRSKGRKYEQTK